MLLRHSTFPRRIAVIQTALISWTACLYIAWCLRWTNVVFRVWYEINLYIM